MRRAQGGGVSEDAMDRLRLNLDRARLLPGPYTHHVVVDASSGQLYYYGAGKRAGSMKVVVGAPETPTPMLAGKLQRLEEHTSELQSLMRISYAVFCLKKKNDSYLQAHVLNV